MPATARKFSYAMLPVAATAIAASSIVAPAHAATTTTASTPYMEPQQTLTATYQKPRITRVDRALNIMRSKQGDPYSYGSAGPNAFDCSGLVFYATHRAGFRGVPRTSGAQAGYMRHVSKSAMRPGDFVFFSSGGHVYHVGVYVGSNRILHAPFPGARVRIERIWTSSWFGGTLRGR